MVLIIANLEVIEQHHLLSRNYHHLIASFPVVGLSRLLVVLVCLAHHLGLDMYEQICLVYGIGFVFLQVFS